MDSDLGQFYKSWSVKSEQLLQHDLNSGKRKAHKIVGLIKACEGVTIRSMLDYGCGYGALMKYASDSLGLTNACGFEYSEAAIQYAQKTFGSDRLKFHGLESLDIGVNKPAMAQVLKEDFGVDKVDCIVLADLLEHVPDCTELILNLAEMTSFFAIKLPIEFSCLDNYLFQKEYPGIGHSNGHLREFDVNNVHYFIRSLGLTPLREEIYVYSITDAFPPQENITRGRALRRNVLKYSKLICSLVLPKRIFLKVIGGGGYCCIATFDRKHVLKP